MIVQHNYTGFLIGICIVICLVFYLSESFELEERDIRTITYVGCTIYILYLLKRVIQ